MTAERRGTPLGSVHLFRLAVLVWLLIVATSCSDDPIVGDSTVSVADTDVRIIDRRPDVADPSPVTVVLLHGASFSATTWADNGILDTLTERDIGAVAVDLPGYGETPSIETDRGQFLIDLLGSLDIEHPVVVSPSMSGNFSLPALEIDPMAFAGFVPVAPTGIDAFAGVSSLDAPVTMIVWGSEDDVIPVEESQALASKIPDASIELISGAGHAAYEDNPDDFASLMIAFVRSVETII